MVWAVCVCVGVHTSTNICLMGCLDWLGGALGLGVAPPDAASWCARIHFRKAKVLHAIKGVGLVWTLLRMRISTASMLIHRSPTLSPVLDGHT